MVGIIISYRSLLMLMELMWADKTYSEKWLLLFPLFCELLKRSLYKIFSLNLAIFLIISKRKNSYCSAFRYALFHAHAYLQQINLRRQWKLWIECSVYQQVYAKPQNGETRKKKERKKYKTGTISVNKGDIKKRKDEIWQGSKVEHNWETEGLNGNMDS